MLRRVLIAVCLLASYAGAQSSPAGVWRGESLCTPDSSSACHDEKVVYYIEAIAGKPDAMLIRADKIVDGQAITMGSGPWKYDREKQTLSWEPGGRLWLLSIKGTRIEGTLTEPDKKVIRRMTLTKDG